MKNNLQWSLGISVLLISASSFATGLQVWTLSAASLGDLGAGAAASANSPDTSYFNPAGSPWIQHQDMGFSMIASKNDVKYQGNVTANPAISNLTQRDASHGDHWLYMPNLFYVAPLDNQWAVGFSVSSPYADNVEYDTNTPVRYLSSRWYLDTTDITPSVAYRFIPQLSVGLGLDFEHAALHLNQFSTSSDSANDVKSMTDLGSWGFGWTLGSIWQPQDSTRVGLTYHSAIKQDAKGNSFSGKESRAQSTYHLPPSTTLSIYQQLGQKFTLLGSADYTQWNRFNNITINNMMAYSGVVNNTLLSGLKNTWLVSAGMHYQCLQSLMLKTAIGYQQGSVSGNQITPIYPDVSQYLVGLGTNYQINTSFNVDMGYRYAFSQNNVVVSSSQSVPGHMMTSDGTLKASSNSFGLQLNWLMT
jgi:long-chain fatty acid transport protein